MSEKDKNGNGTDDCVVSQAEITAIREAVRAELHEFFGDQDGYGHRRDHEWISTTRETLSTTRSTVWTWVIRAVVVFLIAIFGKGLAAAIIAAVAAGGGH